MVPLSDRVQTTDGKDIMMLDGDLEGTTSAFMLLEIQSRNPFRSFASECISSQLFMPSSTFSRC